VFYAWGLSLTFGSRSLTTRAKDSILKRPAVQHVVADKGVNLLAGAVRTRGSPVIAAWKASPALV
jgi:hypothetical protein